MLLASVFTGLSSKTALAQTALDAGASTGMISGILGAVALGGAAAVATWALAQKRKLAAEDADRRGQMGRLQAELDRVEALIEAGDEVIVQWSGDGMPKVSGRLSLIDTAPSDVTAFLSFGSWLTAESATELDRAVANLRSRGEVFSLSIATKGNIFVEAIGRTIGTRAFVRIRNLAGERLEHAELRERYGRLVRDVDVVRALLHTMPQPVWMRGADGKLTWVNQAYADAVDADNEADAVSDSMELLDSRNRDIVTAEQLKTELYTGRQPVIINGKRRVADIVDVSSEMGSAGIATDVSALEEAETALRRALDFHTRTLDQLATAVAIFGSDKRLRFYNQAFTDLFGLSAAFLEQSPEDSAVLDQLRAQRKLPEQADYKSWKRDILASYQAVEARELWWHLPDGKTLRVVANPHPQGGVTYIYENVTEQIELESRYNTLTRVQGETLDHLSEAVAVFGSDGRLRLFNPAFQKLWGVASKDLEAEPHIRDLSGLLDFDGQEQDAWDGIARHVTGLADSRERNRGRIENEDGRVIDFATVPLPDGASMLTFTNVTATVQVQRALKERNDALEEADRLKNTFIQHISYELRSPLTNIIGFAELLNDVRIGELNDKQGEYIEHIMSSGAALLALINDILDLATIDAGIMELNLTEIDVRTTLEAAIEGIRDRLQEEDITIQAQLPEDGASFVGDEKRIRQVLFNLLSNAIAHSDKGDQIELHCEIGGSFVRFAVCDNGSGIPQDILDTVFDRFISGDSAGGRRGAGLGLSIVKSFVELHGGEVEVQSTEGEGSMVSCSFPLRPDQLAQAAE
ncbi:PAS domain-containing sensor histidine kinase [Coralliovum pocilloporae]|uniref:PAS domain-containing sensor histidine kinase n=1 Tax=Coralliovum pocilloporae TaxID=3066369 RepID=UPI0033074475